MPLSLTLSLATLCIAYLYPLYATYKVLTAVQRNGSTVNAYSWYGPAKQKQEQDASAPDRPTELAELETLGMYWAVMAVVRVAEAWIEWSWRWYVARLTTQDPLLSTRQARVCPVACPAANQGKRAR